MRGIRSMPRRSRATGLAALGLATVLLSGCTTSDGDGGAGGGGPCLDFLPAPAPTPPSVVARKGAGSTCGRLEVELLVTDVDDVWGLGLQGTYAETVATLLGTSHDGTFLESDGSIAYSGEETLGEGQFQAGIGRLEATTGVDAMGAKYAMTLIFERVGDSGTTELGITQSGVGGPPLNPGEDPVPIPGVTWALGTISVLVL